MLYVPGNIFFEKLRQLVKRRLQDTQVAYLGNGAGVVEISDRRGYVYARYYEGKLNGVDTYSAPFPVRSAGAAFQSYEGFPVNIKFGKNNELEIDSAVFSALDRAGIDTRTFNPLHPQSVWVYLWQITIGLATATATTTTDSFLVSVKKHLTYFNNVFRYFETGTEAEKFDFTAYNPAADQYRYAIVWQDVYGAIGETTASTSQSLFMPLSIEDVNEAVANRPPDAIPYKAFVLANNGGTLTQSVQEIDLRQFLNTPAVHGFPNPVAYRERIHPDRQVVFTGSLVVTGSLQVLGSLVGIGTGGDSGSGSSGAPTDATYLLQVADGDLPNAQAMGALATGLVKNTTTTGVQSIAVAGTDYVSPDLEHVKSTVRVATTAALPACTYANGSSGVGATLTANANGALIIELLSIALNDRVLVKNQAALAHNGIYICTQAGTAGTPFILTRTTNCDSGDEITSALVVSRNGTVNNDVLFYCEDTVVTVGTDNISFRPTALPQGATLLIPTIADLTNANHDHEDAAGGGQLNASNVFNAGTVPLARLPNNRAILIDSKATTTVGGTSTTATWNARDLNTEQYDPNNIVTLSSNKFTPIAGDYILQAYSPFVGGSAALSRARNRLFNVTGAAAVEEGSGVFAAGNNSGMVILDCTFTANGSDEYRIDTYTSVGRATDGLGFAVSDGSAETYTVVILEKIA